MKKVIAAVVIFAIFSLSSAGAVFAASFNSYAVKNDLDILVDGKPVLLGNPPVIINGRTLVPARAVFEKLGAEVEWVSDSKSINVKGYGVTVNLKIGDCRAVVNNNVKKLEVSPFLLNGLAMLPLRFVAESLKAEVVWDPENNMIRIYGYGKSGSVSRGTSRRNYVVVIDAGHGGKEAGAVYGGVKEKDLNLEIAKRLNTLLKAEGIKTYMTRYGDSTVGLYARTAFANKVGADLLVSVHNNAGSSKTSGTMTLYYPGRISSRGTLTSREFASIVQRELTSSLDSKNLGVIARPNLAVLRTARMPAVIAEIGYMSNKNELNKLKSQSYKQKAAEALKRAVLAALKKT